MANGPNIFPVLLVMKCCSVFFLNLYSFFCYIVSPYCIFSECLEIVSVIIMVDQKVVVTELFCILSLQQFYPTRLNYC